MSNGKLKNEFRDEVRKLDVSEQELLERDQRVTYLDLKNQAELKEADTLHLKAMIEKLKAFGIEIFLLPDSVGRTAILEHNKKHIEQLEKQMEAYEIVRAQQVILSILEEKFGLQVEAESPELKDD